jgi:Tfp pilus assembly protein PilF
MREPTNRLHPGSPEVFFELAAMLAAERHYSDAEAMLLKVIEKEPGHTEAHFLLSQCFQKAGQIDAAKREREIFKKLKGSQQGQGNSDAGPSGANAALSAAGKP